MMNREVKTMINHFPTETQEDNTAVRTNESRYKRKCKEYHDKQNKIPTQKMKPGDAVVVKRENKRKARTIYKPGEYNIIVTKRLQISAERMKENSENHVTLQLRKCTKAKTYVTSTDSPSADLEPTMTGNPDMSKSTAEKHEKSGYTKRNNPTITQNTTTTEKIREVEDK